MQEETKKSPSVLTIIITILLFILVVQAAILISKLDRPAPADKKITSEEIKDKQPAQNATAQSVQPPITVAYDPFSAAAAPRRPRYAPNYTSDMEDPFAAMEKLQNRMNHLFDTALFGSQMMAQNLMNNPTNAIPDFDLEPPVDIQDDGKNYIVKSDMPGLEKDKISISISGNLLAITGTRENISEKTDAATGFVSQERSYGSFSKSLNLPGPVDETKVFADYKNGVLTIRLPKAEVKKSQQKVSVQ